MNRDITLRLIFLSLLPILVIGVAVLATGSALAASGSDDDRALAADFIKQVFGTPTPRAQVIWMSGDTKKAVRAALGERPAFLRQRYWRDGQRTAWVIDQVGKERPITFGVVVNNGRIEQLRVLAFRESRGGEIRHAFYTDQYRYAGLDTDHRLDQTIDGITGATLSHRAAKKVSRLALILHQRVTD